MTNLTKFLELTGISGIDRPYNIDGTDHIDQY